MKITPEEQEILDKAKLIAEKANPEGDDKKDDDKWEDFEKRFKDTQASFTKAQQDKVEMAKMLVEADPKNVEKIPDEKIRAKVLQENWGVDTIEELKVMFPDYDKSWNDDEDEKTDLEKLQQKVKLMEYQWTKTKTNEEIASVIATHKDVIATIPEFETKLREQMKFISETISPKERVDMAFKLVVGTSAGAGAYGAMQGITWFSAGKTSEPEKKTLGSDVVKDIMSKRRM